MEVKKVEQSDVASFSERLLILFGVSFLLGVGFFIPFLPINVVKSEQVPFEIEATQNDGLELGDSRIVRVGMSGEKQITYKYTKSLFEILFNRESKVLREISSKVVAMPVSEVVQNGTKKYQYMWCSNGSYSHYTDEQFKDKDTGFTKKSEDSCAKGGGGKMIKLADSAPPGRSSAKSISPARVSSNTIGEPPKLGGSSSGSFVPSLQYQPIELGSTQLKTFTPAPQRKITVDPKPTPPPLCYYYQGNGVCFP